MSLLVFIALVSGGATVLLILGALQHVPRKRRTPRVTSLNLGAATMSNAVVGVPKKFVITPKAGEVAVDLSKFPTALTGVVWSVANPAIASINVTKPDGTEAEVTFSEAGATQVVVTGKDKDGNELTERLDVVGEVPVPLVTSLNLAEA